MCHIAWEVSLLCCQSICLDMYRYLFRTVCHPQKQLVTCWNDSTARCVCILAQLHCRKHIHSRTYTPFTWTRNRVEPGSANLGSTWFTFASVHMHDDNYHTRLVRLRKCGRWRWKSGHSLFSLFSTCCGCVGGAQHVDAHWWWEDMASRARILRFTAAQSQQRLFLYALLSRWLSTACLQRRTVWARQRNRSYLPWAVTSWSDTKWKQNFRVSRATFCFLCWELRPFLQRREVVRAPFSVEQSRSLSHKARF